MTFYGNLKMNEETLIIDPDIQRIATERGMTGESDGLAERRGSLPRLLEDIPAHGAMGLERHLSVHGCPPELGRARRRRGEAPLIGELAMAGLRGHGGASFPTATKLKAVARARGKAIVVVNGAEGEPASLKDRTLLQTLPHLVLDGAQLAAEALGAEKVLVCPCETAPASVAAVSGAIAERHARGTDPADTTVQKVPGRYIAGQESALVNFLNGGPAVPTFTEAMVFEQGVQRRPTLVANAETYAHVALIAKHGAGWFRQLGTQTQPGSALVTLGGAVSAPGVYEIEYGSSLRSLVQAAGGTTSKVGGLLIGGYGGNWIDGRLAGGVALSDEHLAPHGAMLGAGVVFLLSSEACPVTETARVLTWLDGQRAGQCGPCSHGLPAIAETVWGIAEGGAGASAGQRVSTLARLVTGRGACGHPDGAAKLAMSALEAFAPEFADHAKHGPCDGCSRQPELPLPTGAPPAGALPAGARLNRSPADGSPARLTRAAGVQIRAGRRRR
jgi:NADH:ubiquinone oxidoreductase subunit F (NADH-binding)